PLPISLRTPPAGGAAPLVSPAGAEDSPRPQAARLRRVGVHGGRLRSRLDSVHWADPRLDPDARRDPGKRRTGHGTARDLCARARRTLPDHGRRARSLSLLVPRSEEHTSELQSRFDLVCRLLLEKKKTHNI